MSILDIDFLFFVASIVANLSLAYVVFSHAEDAKRKHAFIVFVCAQIAWAVTNYFSFDMTSAEKFLWFSRFTLFFAVFHTYTFFLLTRSFADDFIGPWLGRFLGLVAIIIACLTLSPLTFTTVDIDAIGEFVPSTGVGMIAFGLFDMLMLLGGLFLLIKTFFGAKNDQRQQIKYLLIGLMLTVGMILVLILFNFLVFGNLTLVRLGHLYTLPFVILAAYAIVKHHLFNTKIIATETLIVLILTLFFVRIFAYSSRVGQIVDIIIFIATFFFGILLVRSIKREIASREKIQTLAGSLAASNKALEVSNEKLRILDQRKSEFVSIVSHQLRSPVTAMKGYASLLLEESYGKLSDKQKAPIEKIFASSERLAEMISDFLNISKIEQGTMTYTYASVDLRVMISDLTEEFSKKAEAKGLTLVSDLPEGAFIVSVDNGKIRQCFSNLIDNSIKYTPKGEVRITIEQNPAHKTILTRVKDTGIGLSQEDIHHLFGKFTRGSEGQRQNTDGSGLGLYVAKQMIEAMRGKIWVDSEGPGHGSTFVIELPVEPYSASDTAG